MIKIKETGEYVEMLEELLLKKPVLRDEVERKVRWFEKNPNDTRLDNHPLRKQMQGKWAFSIDENVRIVYEWLGHNTARFLAIGGHNRVYLSL